MDKREIKKQLIDQYLSDEAGAKRLARDYENWLAKKQAGDTSAPEVDSRILAKVREAGAQQRNRKRRYVVPLALAASLVAVFVVGRVLIPAGPVPDVNLLGSVHDDPAAERELAEIRELAQRGGAEQAAKRLAEFKKNHPDYPLPSDLRHLE